MSTGTTWSGRRAERGHPWFTAVYRRLDTFAGRRGFDQVRAELVRRATGEVLEIGAGLGSNVPHYRADRVVLAEPDPAMRRHLVATLPTAPVPADVIDAPAERLPLPDASVDTVVSTLVLCTVDDVAASLAEVRRVLRPGGRLLFLEHVAAEGKAYRTQRRLDHVWPRLFGGCVLTRDTVASIRAAGFTIEDVGALPMPTGKSPAAPIMIGSASRP